MGNRSRTVTIALLITILCFSILWMLKYWWLSRWTNNHTITITFAHFLQTSLVERIWPKKYLKLKSCRIRGIFWHEIMFLIFCYVEWVGRKASLASNMIQSFRMVGHHPYATLEENATRCFGFKIDRLLFLQKRSSSCQNQVLLWMFWCLPLWSVVKIPHL